jgi:hypothetical protein
MMKLVAVLMVCAVPVLAQDTQTQPAPDFAHPWAKFKEGSFVKTTVTMKMGGMDMETSQKQTLKTIGKDEVVIEIDMDIPGLGQQKRDQTLSLKGLPGSSEDKSKKVGDEEIECDGQKYKCEIWEYANEEVTSKVWYCKDAKVCGNVLKSEQNSKAGGVESKIKMKVVKLSDKIKVGEKEIDCTVAEIETESEQMKLSGKTWQNGDIPGFTVKSELKGTAQGLEGEVNTKIVEFEKK